MRRFIERGNYTKNGKQWPIIPITLSRDRTVLNCYNVYNKNGLKIYAPDGIVPEDKLDNPPFYMLGVLATENCLMTTSDHVSLNHEKPYSDIPYGIQEYIVSAVIAMENVPTEIKDYFCNAITDYATRKEEVNKSLLKLAEVIRQEDRIEPGYHPILLYALQNYKENIPNALCELCRISDEALDSAKELPRMQFPYGWDCFNSIPKELQLYYRIGLNDEHILGWAMGITEELEHPTLIWQRAYCDTSISERNSDKPWTEIKRHHDKDTHYMGLKKLETEKYYSVMSPICGKCKEMNKCFCDDCKKQDEDAVIYLWELLDRLGDNFYDGEEITIERADNDSLILTAHSASNGHFYFTYICNRIGKMTEMIFPMWFEKTVIALVMVGQIIHDMDETMKAAKEILDFLPDKEKQKVVNYIEDNTTKLAKRMLTDGIDWHKNEMERVFKHVDKRIRYMLAIYEQQLEGERRRVMVQAFDALAALHESAKIDSGKTESELKENIFTYYIFSLTYIKHTFGLEAIYLYLDEKDLKAESNVDGVFYSNWKEDTNRKSWFEHIAETGDLFEKFKGIDTNKYEPDIRELIPSANSQWSVFINSGTEQDAEPLIIGIKYYSEHKNANGEPRDKVDEDRTDYHIATSNGKTDALLMETFVLPRFVVYLRNALAIYFTQRGATLLDDHSRFLEHEVGQIAAAVRALNYEYKLYLDDVRNQLNAKYKSSEYFNEMEKLYQTIYEKAELYRGDMEGNFNIIEVLSKFDEGITPNPESFDVCTRFLNKWRLTFASHCRKESKRLTLPRILVGNPIRSMYTAPVLLETIIYNVVNNAIKYSYACTHIYVDLCKSADGKKHIFTVTDYGDYLEKKDERILEKGYRGDEKQGVHSFVKNQDGILEEKRDVLGAGMGLYWSKLLADKLNCTINWSCEPISNYQVPLMGAFIDRYESNGLFPIFWEKMDEIAALMGIELNVDRTGFDNLKNEYEDLRKRGEIDKIYDYNEKIIKERLSKVSVFTFYRWMLRPTYKVTFTIEVPVYKEGL